MEYVYQFDIAAIIITLMLILMMFLRNTYPTLSCKIYKSILWLNLISSTFDLISSFTISYASDVSIFLNYFVKIIYLLSHNFMYVMFFVYIVAVTKNSKRMIENNLEKIFCFTVVIIETLFICTTPLTRLIFYIDETGYHHGPLMIILYIIAFVIMIYALLLFVYSWKKLGKLQNLTNIFFLTLLMAAVILQSVIQSILIESFCVAVALLMMNVATDNPAMYFYRNTYCYNQTAFNTMTGDKLQSGEKFVLLSFGFDSMMIYRSKFGNETYYEKIDKIISILHKNFGKKKVYTFGGGDFAVEVDEKDIDETVKTILIKIKNIPMTSEERSFLSPHFCVLSCPKFAETVGEINDSIRRMLNEVYKTTGGTITYANSQELKEKRRAALITHKLHWAINNDGFEVYYQPIYSWKDNKYISVEALLRLKNQDKNDYIGPDEFVPIAEQTGIILDIDEIMFEKVCRFWQRENLGKMGINYVDINVSKMELLNKYSLDRKEELCNRYKVPKECVNLEITETAGVGQEKSKKIENEVQHMQEIGFTFSLDDYGSGYSSTTYLAAMPFVWIKLDKEILWKAMKNGDYKAVLESMVKLIHNLNKKCVVEGVETVEMVDMLREMGCEYFQGYYYSKPLTENELLEFLKNNNNSDLLNKFSNSKV